MRKFEIKNNDDYHDFLYGKILRIADELGRYDEELSWVQHIHQTRDMEDHLEVLIEELFNTQPRQVAL